MKHKMKYCKTGLIFVMTCPFVSLVITIFLLLTLGTLRDWEHWMRRCCFPSHVCIRFFNFQLLFRKASKPIYIYIKHTCIHIYLLTNKVAVTHSEGNILLLLLFIPSWFSSVSAFCCMQVGHAQSTIYHTVAAGFFFFQ